MITRYNYKMPPRDPTVSKPMDDLLNKINPQKFKIWYTIEFNYQIEEKVLGTR